MKRGEPYKRCIHIVSIRNINYNTLHSIKEGGCTRFVRATFLSLRNRCTEGWANCYLFQFLVLSLVHPYTFFGKICILSRNYDLWF